MVHPEDREAVKLNARDMLRGKRSSPHEFRITTLQGSVRWVLETVASITFGGRPAILGNSMDITEEKRAQERLRESETWYRTLFETTGAATMILEEDTTISLVNREFVHQFGYTREETENRKSWTEFIAPEDLGRMREITACGGSTRRGRRKTTNSALSAIRESPECLSHGGHHSGDAQEHRLARGHHRSQKGRRDPEGPGAGAGEQDDRARGTQRGAAGPAETPGRRPQQLEEKVLSNVKKLVLPYIKSSKKPSRSHDEDDVLILESNLRDIIAPFSTKLS